MAISDILASIDRDIAQLQQARVLLGGTATTAPKKKAGRPKKTVSSVGAKAVSVKKAVKKTKRNLSPEARKRIADAAKRRWAATKKAAEGAEK
jgi:predicted nucleotide-binding protein (sugar kinase/HSP70/actin superfamily)